MTLLSTLGTYWNEYRSIIYSIIYNLWLTLNENCFQKKNNIELQQGGSRTTSLTWKYIKVCGYSDSFCKNVNQRSLTPRWPLTPHLLRSYVWLYPRIIVSKSHENTSKYVDTVTFFAKNLNQKSLTPRWPFTPHLLRSHVWLYPRIIVSKSHENTSKYVDTVTFFAQNLNQRSLTPRWPLTPHLLRSHVWLYPRIIVSKSYGNTSMYVDTVINFANHHIHILRTYYIHTTYRISDHIVSLRRDKNVNITTFESILHTHPLNTFPILCSPVKVETMIFER